MVHTLSARLLLVVATAVLLLPVTGGSAYAAEGNSLGGQTSCDLDTGMVHADWRYTNVRGPATMVDVSVSPTQFSPAITTNVPVGETVIARVSFPLDTEQVTLTFTIVGDGWSDSYSSPAVSSVCPKTQVQVSFATQCDTSLTVTMRNKPFSTATAELTIVPVVPSGATLGPFLVAPGQQRSVTVPPPTTYVRVFLGSEAIAGNSGPRPTPCTQPPVAGGGPGGAAPQTTATTSGTPAASASASAAATATPTSAPPTSATGRSTPVPVALDRGTGALPWIGGGAALLAVAAAALTALLVRARRRPAPATAEAADQI